MRVLRLIAIGNGLPTRGRPEPGARPVGDDPRDGGWCRVIDWPLRAPNRSAIRMRPVRRALLTVLQRQQYDAAQAEEQLELPADDWKEEDTDQ